MENPYLRAELTKPCGVAARLADARTRANLSGKDLAQRLGCPPSRISKLELGTQMPTAEDVHDWLLACSADRTVIREVQADLEQLRLRQPEFRTRLLVEDNFAIDIPASGPLREAYRQGYVTAVREMQSRLNDMLWPSTDET
jgi:transcriptional regulator with XRE-family HTH domain